MPFLAIRLRIRRTEAVLSRRIIEGKLVNYPFLEMGTVC